MSNDKLLKKYLNDKTFMKADIDIEKLIIDSIITSLKTDAMRELGTLGYLKKTTKMIEGRSTKEIDFFANDDSLSKMAKNYKKNRDIKLKDKKNKRLLTYTLIPVFIVILIALLLFLLKFDFLNLSKNQSNLIKNKLNSDSIETKKDSNYNSNNQDLSKDYIIYNDKKIMKEKIDYKDKEVVVNKDKSIIVKTEAKNDTNLKEGEFTTEIVAIDGKIYDKNLYIIKKGDTLWDIAQKFLKNPFLWPNIHKDNPYIKNPHRIEPNYKLTIYTLKE